MPRIRKSANDIEISKQAPDVIVPTNANVAITMKEYGAVEQAFDFFNARLCGGRLPDAMFTYTRKPRMLGHFAPDRYSGRVAEFRKPEIALNPDAFINQTDMRIASILVHEMKHLEQEVFGKPSKRGYHNKEWAAMMKSIGLMPSNTGAVGGKETGQQMDHFIIPGGAFEHAFTELAGGGWRLNLQSTTFAGTPKAPPSKLKFSCPACSQNAWGKPDLAIRCDLCDVRMTAPAEAAPDDRKLSEAAE